MAEFTITPDGHGFILSGELDVAHEAEFVAAFAGVLHGGGPVTIDMRQLVFMDSSGIKTIIAAAKASEDCIVLHGVHDEVQRVVEITKIDQLSNLHVMPCTVGVGPASA